MYFKAPKHKVEVLDKEQLPITKTKLTNDQGVVTLETSCDVSSSESDIEIEPLPSVAVKKIEPLPSVALKKRVHEEIGKIFGFVLLVYLNALESNFLNYFCFLFYLDIGNDSEEETVMLITSDLT